MHSQTPCYRRPCRRSRALRWCIWHSRKCFLILILTTHMIDIEKLQKAKFIILCIKQFLSAWWRSTALIPHGMKSEPIEINSHFNRLVIMRTTINLACRKRNNFSTNRRMCISNYYFSSSSPMAKYYHSASFRGFPGELKKDELHYDLAQLPGHL